ncbi:hypothetical protein BLOT_009214 [Blomia tropicalis]|nr:hypothetical protein BLOT_009214 [Blomia tropicalis]
MLAMEVLVVVVVYLEFTLVSDGGVCSHQFRMLFSKDYIYVEIETFWTSKKMKKCQHRDTIASNNVFNGLPLSTSDRSFVDYVVVDRDTKY